MTTDERDKFHNRRSWRTNLAMIFAKPTIRSPSLRIARSSAARADAGCANDLRA
jgi:hypothetical protein